LVFANGEYQAQIQVNRDTELIGVVCLVDELYDLVEEESDVPLV